MNTKTEFKLIPSLGYFRRDGVDVMAFDDIYPEGHQSGVSIIMHGNRVATNGDIRFEQTPGQWQPVPKQGKREFDEAANTITTHLRYPDESKHLKGFNPMIYPDFCFGYSVCVKGEGASVIVTVDLDEPVPERFVGKICFNLELFPGFLFGKPWIMDNKQGIFPIQPNGPVLPIKTNANHVGDFCKSGEIIADIRNLASRDDGYNPIVADDYIAEPYATGKRLTIRPDDSYNRVTIESCHTELKLYDGRLNHNNGWFVVSSEIPAGVTKEAVKWVITPNVVADWLYSPVVQISQVGYHPSGRKVAVIERDKRETLRESPLLYKITETGEELICKGNGSEWGQFLRYSYLQFDFSDITDEGLYKIKYGASESSIFRIADDIYDRGVWQPVLEYFLPVQMCHMRVSEKYRVWHGLCHCDDASVAPLRLNHFDGYVQGESALSERKPGEHVAGLNVGGWHDAGDFDLRVESQAGEVYVLSLAYEAFNIAYDATSIDQATKTVEIHLPDGKNDILQQIEHGVLFLAGAYRVMWRHFRGVICNNLRQYVHLGDSAVMTDGIINNEDDRFVFTEDNPVRELTTAAQLAAASRALKGFNDDLSKQALDIASDLYSGLDKIVEGKIKSAKIHAAAELFLTTGDVKYKDFLLAETEVIINEIENFGWIIAKVEKLINNAEFTNTFCNALPSLNERICKQCEETPYGIPYKPQIWGAGWGIQRMGFQYYYLHKAYPNIFGSDVIFNALNFILGCHPGSNAISFASGIGTKSATVGYGLNRADWSYIPGGVVSGTALIKPDFPELLKFPYLWQQVEYVMGGGSSHFMFLVLAARQISI